MKKDSEARASQKETLKSMSDVGQGRGRGVVLVLPVGIYLPLWLRTRLRLESQTWGIKRELS